MFGFFSAHALRHAEHFLRIVLPDLEIGDHRHADAFEDRLLIPRLADAIAVDRARLERRRHLRRRRHGQQHVGLDLAAHIGRRIETRMEAARREPVAQLVVVRGDRKHHRHLERLAVGLELLDDGLQRVGLDRMHRLALRIGRHVRLHQRPHFVRDRGRVAVQIHAERGDDVGFGAEADGRAERLAGEHVRAVEFAGDDAIENHFPVRLRLERDVQPFVFEEALLVRDGERRHVGELDEAELELLLLELELPQRHADERQRPSATRAADPERAVQHGFAPLPDISSEQKKTLPTSSARDCVHRSRQRCPARPLLGALDSVDDESSVAFVSCNRRATRSTLS